MPAGHVDEFARPSRFVFLVSLLLASEDDVFVGGEVVATEEEVEEEELSEQ